ncbi:MAG: DUF445 family protein [Planctomycetes bacterium]|nr:DUF445 family protein [Planctomycetota bacterium]MCW8137269.1 DUF445 family protein [Planctomycetota bacterium]
MPEPGDNPARAPRGFPVLAVTGLTLASMTVAGAVLRHVFDDALWTAIFFAVSIGGLVGFATNWVAIKMLFHPRVRVFGVQGVVPKRRLELARSVGETLEEHLISGDRMHRLLLDSGAVDQAIDRIAAHIPQLLADEDARKLVEAEVDRTIHTTMEDIIRASKASLKANARSTVNAALAGGGAAAMFAKLGPLAAALAGGLTAGGMKAGLLDPVIDKVVDKLAEDLVQHESLGAVGKRFVATLPQRTGEVLSNDKVRARLRGLIGDMAGELVNAVDVAGLIESELLARDEGELEALIDRVAANELSFIQVAGGGLGMIAGLALIWPWLLIPIGAVFGLMVIIARMAERKHTSNRKAAMPPALEPPQPPPPPAGETAPKEAETVTA